MNTAKSYPNHGISYEVYSTEAAGEYDACRISCPENMRGFENTRRYLFGIKGII